MSKLVVHCPSCQGELLATRLTCKTCGVQLEGKFEIPLLLLLSAEDLAWVTDFVRSSGSLKDVAKKGGVSYPTVRNRLDEIIRKLDELERGIERRRHEILDALERGELTAQAAAEQLQKVGL